MTQWKVISTVVGGSKGINYPPMKLANTNRRK